MNGPLYRFSVATVSFARLVEAGVNLLLAVAFVFVTLWLTLSFGVDWLIIALDIFLGLIAVQLFVEACTVYSTSRSAERPDERERYLRSRFLYIPGRRREDRDPASR